MIEYGVLASNSSEMFSDISFELKDIFFSHPYIIIGIGVFAVVFYLMVWK